jgi:hypothetical protein
MDQLEYRIQIRVEDTSEGFVATDKEMGPYDNRLDAVNMLKKLGQQYYNELTTKSANMKPTISTGPERIWIARYYPYKTITLVLNQRRKSAKIE